MTDDTQDKSAAPCGVSPRLLELLICPVTGGPLIFDRDACELISKKAKLAFPIKDGLPLMLESEARDLETSK
nr:Trm112 family protein [Hyphomonas sp. Mor2]